MDVNTYGPNTIQTRISGVVQIPKHVSLNRVIEKHFSNSLLTRHLESGNRRYERPIMCMVTEEIVMFFMYLINGVPR